MRETLHRRRGARVDYYRTVTGVPRVETVEDPRREGQLIRTVRLEGVQELVTCGDCWSVPGVQRELADLRHSGAGARG